MTLKFTLIIEKNNYFSNGQKQSKAKSDTKKNYIYEVLSIR